MFNKLCSAILYIVTTDIIFNRVLLNRESVTERTVKDIVKNLSTSENEDSTEQKK